MTRVVTFSLNGTLGFFNGNVVCVKIGNSLGSNMGSVIGSAMGNVAGTVVQGVQGAAGVGSSLEVAVSGLKVEGRICYDR